MHYKTPSMSLCLPELEFLRKALVGLWARFDPAALATREAFRRDPTFVWGWYEWRRMQVYNAQPNLAHRAIAELSAIVPKLTLVTQNVDDLHERAGSIEVIHLQSHVALPAPGSLSTEAV